MIRVKVDTSGYGGKMIRQAVRIQTDDPEHPYLGIVVTGFVDMFAELSKKHVRLAGRVSDRLFEKIIITPKEEYPFLITDAKAKDGRNLSFQINEEMDGGKRRYILSIRNVRKEKGTYADVINLYTDSNLKKIIPITVIGDIREKVVQ